MKKLSISLFALLAICLAVTSAYTTNNSVKTFDTFYEAWGITPDAVDVTTPPQNQQTAYANRKANTRFKQSSTDFDLPTEYAAQAVFQCLTADSDDLCAAKIKVIDGVAENAVIVQFLAGDYSAF